MSFNLLIVDDEALSERAYPNTLNGKIMIARLLQLPTTAKMQLQK